MNRYKDKTILITGHTGFKGSWLVTWLTSLGANVVGLSIDVPSNPSNYAVSEIQKLIQEYRVDIRDREKVLEVVKDTQPDFIFHLAAQALVRLSYESPLETMQVNALGSINILDALRQLDKNVIAVMITSDKAYDNLEWVWGYRETDRLGGKDPYSASKGMAELAIRSYVESYFKHKESNIRVGITRAGNVIGGGDWAADRLVPDCVSAWSLGNVVDVRNPNATRPWQHVLEPLSGYLTLGLELANSAEKNGQAYNFGPPANQNYSVKHLIEGMEGYWDNVRWSDKSNKSDNIYEAGLLKLNCDKALHELDWLPALEFVDTVRMTIEWYKTFYQDESQSMYEYSLNQIKEYIKHAKEKQISWAMQ